MVEVNYVSILCICRPACRKRSVHFRGRCQPHQNVLRLEVGDWIVACDGNGTDYVSRIQSICSDEVVASIEKVQPTGTELPVRITLFQGMPKKDKLELIIQKAVELGACEIVPVMTKRTVVKLSEEKKINKRLERWQSIAYAAAKQCDRGIIPTVHQTGKL